MTTLHKIAYLRCSLGISRSWNKVDLFEVESQPAIAELCRTLIKAIDEYHKRHYVSYMNTIEQFIKIFDLQRDRISITTSLAIARLLNCSINAPMLTPTKEEDWFKSLRILGEQLLDKKIKQALSSLFHKRTGTTFMQYITKLRMLKAKELLADPSVQVQQAAEQVGYFSSRHFTKLFKEIVGCYPSEYKKNLQMKKEAEGTT
ncbi:helix-turn-helix transcriptional regulator [Paenibacillus sp.]|uniref:helix-turn-helix transcriptional regulator n=1 Tax=Paenibacillus sp. TaxID=58172 RepID=UPI003564084E